MSTNNSLRPLTADREIWFIISGGLIMHIIISALIPAGFDEAYYGAYSFSLNWGYFDHPPMVAIIAGIGHWLSGSFSYLSLRAGSIVLFLFTSIIIYKFAEELFNKEVGRISLLLLYSIPYFFLGIGAFVFPDNALAFFWSAFLLSLLKFQKHKDARWFILSGVLLGLAMLSKYHAIFLLIGWVFCLLFLKEWRFSLKTPYPYWGLILALLIFLPNIFWNAENNWISYVYQFSKSNTSIKPSATLFLQSFAAQATFLFPWHLFVLLGSLWVAHKRRLQFVAFLYPFIIIPIATFAFIGIFRPILPHWPMHGYLAAIPLGAFWISQWKHTIRKKYLVFSIAIMMLIITFISLQVLFGVMKVDKKVDLTLDGTGWRSLVQHLKGEKIVRNNTTFLFTHKWFLGGELAWACEGKYPVTVINSSPHAFAFWSKPEQFIGKTGIFICTDRYRAHPETDYKQYFLSIKRLSDFHVYRDNKIAKTYYIWECKNMIKRFKFPYGKN